MVTTNFTPTLAELALVDRIFQQADIQKAGILTTDVAAKVFGGSKLPIAVLGEIWNIADEKENGFLTKNGIALALRLIGHAQNGDKVRKSLLSVRGPLATTEGVLPPSEEKSTGMSIPKTPPSTPGFPPLTPQDTAKFRGLFSLIQSGGSVDGLLSGEKARDVFIKSRLPTDTLSQIWDLCDTHHRGALDSVDFTIAMHLIQAVMSGKLTFVPTTLPLGLYEQASGGFTAPVSRGSAHLLTPTSSTFPVSPTKRPSVESQFTFQGIHNIPPLLPSRFPGPTIQTPTVPPSPSATGQPFVSWNITPAEKATYDRFFDSLDTLKRGYLEGEVMVPFMLQSKFPEEVLALVWDLADINNDGRLTRDGFAVALCLIQGKLAGKDVPNTLPPTLVPQSMRKTISPFTTATVSQLSELIRDLWDERSPTLNEHNLLHALHQPQLTGPRMDANAMLRSELQHLNCLRGFVQKLPASAATSLSGGTCRGVLRNPSTLRECGHTYCSSSLERSLSQFAQQQQPSVYDNAPADWRAPRLGSSPPPSTVLNASVSSRSAEGRQAAGGTSEYGFGLAIQHEASEGSGSSPCLAAAGSGAGVVVHQDAGRTPEVEVEAPQELSPSYDSIQ